MKYTTVKKNSDVCVVCCEENNFYFVYYSDRFSKFFTKLLETLLKINFRLMLKRI